MKMIDSQSRFDDALLQIETIEIRKTNVQYQALGTRTRGRVRNFLGNRENLRLPPAQRISNSSRFAHRYARRIPDLEYQSGDSIHARLCVVVLNSDSNREDIHAHFR